MNKSGYLTTEFWLSLMPIILSGLVVTGVIKPADSADLSGALTNGITAIGTVVAAAWTVIHYIQSRTTLKVASQADTTKASATAETKS